jgi:acyl-CoA reductase-like NAD-dependent aldehyde dehydrogenase
MNATIPPRIEPVTDFPGEARAAQSGWAQTPIHERLRVVRALRHLIAGNADALAAAAASVSGRPIAEKLVSEVLPLADACRWLEKSAPSVLAPRRCGKRGRPFWMQGVTFEVQRQPFGLVLVIGPGNYPLFLPAVHALHALVAGNAVLLKPAPGTRHVALAFAQLAREAGLDPALLTILPESVQSARSAIADGVDKVIFTGSSENGRDVLAALAGTNTPSVMELSGEDAVIVLADADLDLVVRALRFGSRLNAGKTCIAPRRLIAVATVTEELTARLGTEHRLPACAADGHPACRTGQAGSPLAAQAGSLCSVRDDTAAVLLANSSDFALGASIFSRDIAKARKLAARIKTGFVLINDLIAPTADPRMPFGGVKASGFGTTRGDEGLLEMTFPHVVAERHGRAHPHFEEPAAGDAQLFSAYIRAAHGTRRLAAFRDLFRALITKLKTRKTRP